MSQWKNTDAAGNSVLWAPTSVKLAPNSANRDALYENTTPDAFTSGQTVGQFGVDASETGVTNGSIVAYTITFPGSGYTANAAVTVSGNATANATANGSGRISAVNVNTAGSGYTGTPPTVTIAAPSLITFNGNTAVDAANNTIAISSANSKFKVGDKITYAGNTLSTPVGLTDNGTYYVSFVNSSVLAVSTTLGGANVDIDKAAGDGTTAGGATLRGETAKAVAVLSATGHAVTHAGWVLRTVGTGGRAGRVQYETLVAMGSMTSDSDDTVFKDA